MLYDSDAIKEMGNGKCIEIVHYLNDGLWKLELNN
jgi:predicted ribosome-associated RNA-binding protein Tma20